MAGSGTQEDPYRITNATELQAMNEDLDAHYVLGDDIDASETADWNLGEGFAPVGSRDRAFTGSFDGQNHTVTGLTIDRPASGDTAMIGFANGATIEHVSFVDATVQGASFTAVLAGRTFESTSVTDVSASGSVSGEYATGGLVGQLDGSTLVDGHASVDVTGNEFVGGLVGSIPASRVERSSASGSVSGVSEVGGLVGGPPGSVNAEGSEITRSYATGNVEGEENVGGLAGGNGGTISRGYATGSVSGDENVGGLVGLNDLRLTDAYWSESAAGLSTAVGRERGDSSTTALSADELDGADAQSAMGSFEFGLVWAVTDGNPVLRTEVQSVSLSIPNQVITDRTTTATASVSLADGRSVRVSETADYGTNQSFLSVDRGVLETSGTGMAEVTAMVAGHSDSAAVSVVTPPDISIESRALRYDRVGSETAAPVDVTLTNDGGADGTFDVVLSVNGTVEQTRTVTVPGHSTTTVRLNYSAPPMGTYPVAINGSSLGNLTVVEEPETSVASATLSESLLAVGNTTTVEATVENAGDAAAGHTVELTAGGETVATKDVVVPAGGTTVRFDYTGESAGEYDLAVGGSSAGTLTVAEMGSVSVESVSVPDSVEAGAGYEVTVTLANSGGLPLETEVAYSVGGSSVGSERVEVPADGATVTFEATAPEDSDSIDHRVTAGDAEWTGSTTVDVETPTPTATAGSSGDGSDGDSTDGGDSGSNDGDTTATSGDGPGFGAAAALVALLAIAAFGRRETN